MRMRSNVPKWAELYRQRATECEALAERANDADLRARIRKAARGGQIWSEQVEQLDSAKTASKASRSSQPTAPNPKLIGCYRSGARDDIH